MAEQIKAITKKTLLPLSLVFTLLGGMAWLTTIYNSVSAQGQSLVELKDAQREYNKNVLEINEKLAKMEGELNIIMEKSK